MCNDLTDELNGRILARNTAHGNLDVLLDFRPQPTKYVLPNNIPIPECRSNILHYKTTKTFNPGDKKGSWSGYVSNINEESILRNQIHALQKFPQADFVPNSTSDLYNTTIPKATDNTAELKFPSLFNANIINTSSENLGSKSSIPHLSNLENNLFNNDTRQQLKDS
jgi:hypothetical protein